MSDRDIWYFIDPAVWADCSVPGCPFKSCLALNSDKCYPHTIEERIKIGGKEDVEIKD